MVSEIIQLHSQRIEPPLQIKCIFYKQKWFILIFFMYFCCKLHNQKHIWKPFLQLNSFNLHSIAKAIMSRARYEFHMACFSMMNAEKNFHSFQILHMKME